MSNNKEKLAYTNTMRCKWKESNKQTAGWFYLIEVVTRDPNNHI